MSRFPVFILDSEYPRRSIGCQLGDLNRRIAKIRIPTQQRLFQGIKTSGSKHLKVFPVVPFICRGHPDQSDLKTCTLIHDYQDCHKKKNGEGHPLIPWRA